MTTAALESGVGGIRGVVIMNIECRALRRFSKIDWQQFRHFVIAFNFLAGVAGRDLGISVC